MSEAAPPPRRLRPKARLPWSALLLFVVAGALSIPALISWVLWVPSALYERGWARRPVDYDPASQYLPFVVVLSAAVAVSWWAGVAACQPRSRSRSGPRPILAIGVATSFVAALAIGALFLM